MKVVLFHLTGNANVRAVAYGLAKANLLYEYDVTIASFPGSFLDRLANVPAFSEIKRRQLDSLLQPYTHTFPWKEMGRIILPKIGLSQFSNHRKAPFFVDAVVQDMDKKVAGRLSKACQKGAGAVYGYEDTTVQCFRKAKQLGMTCLYDLPIGYWKAARRLLEAESERWPEWASTINIFHDAEQKLLRKEEELELADHIFVASSFTRQTLQDYGGNKKPVHVIPYGFPRVGNGSRSGYYAGKKPLKLLFVGSLSQRKGIADIFAVAEYFGNQVALTVVGQKVGAGCPALDKALSRHRWYPSLPHQNILKLMREQDVLVFPSLFEGFGLVVTEAMSQGTPVITTDRTAGPDLIRHNENGWLIEAASTAALQQAIENLLDNPSQVEHAGAKAKETAGQRPWEMYEKEMAEAIGKITGTV